MTTSSESRFLRGLARLTPSPVRRSIEKILDPYVRRLTRSIPIAQVDDRDVFIVGFPKSGNTWFQHLTAGLVYHVDLGVTPDALVQDLVPDVHYRQYYRRYGSPMYFKSHARVAPQYRRVVYLVRDGRDAVMSYYHFIQQLDGRAYDLGKVVRDGDGLIYGYWHDHVEEWLANPFRAEMLVIKYEDLRANTVSEVKRFCEFAGLRCSSELVEDVVQKAAFEQMQAREKKFGMEAWDSSKGLFVRRGKVGGFRDEMPSDVLDAFNAGAGATLRKFGYL